MNNYTTYPNAQPKAGTPALAATDFIMFFLLGSAIALVLFFVGRFIVLWYWKINDVIDLLEKIERNTRKDQIVK
jgi:hypothetical protein